MINKLFIFLFLFFLFSCSFDTPFLGRTLIKQHYISELNYNLPGAAGYSEIDLLDDGYPILFFSHNDGGGVNIRRFARWYGDLIFSENSDILFSDSLFEPISLCVDNDDNVHVCFTYDNGGSSMLHYSGGAGFPEMEKDLGAGVLDRDFSIDTVSSGNPYILLAFDGDIYLIYYDSGVWKGMDDKIDTINKKFPNLKIDDEDNIHISYSMPGVPGDIYYAFKNEAGQFIYNNPPQLPNLADFKTYLEIDKKGNPHIIYRNNTILTYIRYRKGAWTSPDPIDAIGVSRSDYDFKLDDNDYPHVAMDLGGAPWGLVYKWKDMNNMDTIGDWYNFDINIGSDSYGYVPSMAIDPDNGMSYIFHYYSDNPNYKMRLAVIQWTH